MRWFKSNMQPHTAIRPNPLKDYKMTEVQNGAKLTTEEGRILRGERRLNTRLFGLPPHLPSQSSPLLEMALSSWPKHAPITCSDTHIFMLP